MQGPAEVPAPPPSGPWVLTGVASSEGVMVPAVLDSRAMLGEACVEANQRVTAADARHPGAGPPCGVERWSNGADTLEVLWAGEWAVLGKGGREFTARATWPSLGVQINQCLGSALALPPGGDPLGQRTTDGEHWFIALKGKGRCGMKGMLKLWMRADRSEAELR